MLYRILGLTLRLITETNLYRHYSGAVITLSFSNETVLHHEIQRENQVVVVDLVAVILEIKLQMTSAPLTTTGTHNREDERKEDAQTNPY